MVLGTQVPAGGLRKPWWSAAAWSAVVKGALTLSTRGVSVWSRRLDSQLEMWKLQSGFPQFLYQCLRQHRKETGFNNLQIPWEPYFCRKPASRRMWVIRSAILFSSLQFAPQKVGSEDVCSPSPQVLVIPCKILPSVAQGLRKQVQSWVRVRGWGSFSSAFIHRQRVPNTKTWSGGLWPLNVICHRDLCMWWLLS